MFQKRHYEFIARALATIPQEARRAAAMEFAYRFASDNPRFDRERFMEACGCR